MKKMKVLYVLSHCFQKSREVQGSPKFFREGELFFTHHQGTSSSRLLLLTDDEEGVQCSYVGGVEDRLQQQQLLYEIRTT